MKKKHTVTVVAPRGNQYCTVGFKAFRTEGLARRYAEKVLAKHPTENTRYTNYMGWEAVLNNGEILQAPEHLVLSVGEKGYW